LAQNWPVDSVIEWEREEGVFKVAWRALSHSVHYAWEYRFWCISSNTWRVMSLPPKWSCDHQTWLPCAQSALNFLRNSTTWRLHNLHGMSGHCLFLAKGSVVLLRTFVLWSLLFNDAVSWWVYTAKGGFTMEMMNLTLQSPFQGPGSWKQIFLNSR
jgi:hypothetical protein